jgi:probable biosynthetic protein (TIGR04099 family)
MIAAEAVPHGAGWRTTSVSVSAVARAHSSFEVGLPQLSLHGLSENWLWKECGQQHWTMLASVLDLPRSGAGQLRHCYAAFTAVRMERASLGDVVEGDDLGVTAWLDRRSRTQFVSRHVVKRSEEVVAILTMVSAVLGRLPAAGMAAPAKHGGESPELWRVARLMRLHRRDRHCDFDLRSRAEESSFRFQPCPHHDFNGAGFLCFASFQSIVDRAHSSRALEDETRAGLRSRDIFYYDNIDVGDSVHVVRAGKRVGPDRPGGCDIGVWDKIVREIDGKVIAEVFSRKILLPAEVRLRRKSRPANDQSSSSVMPGSPLSIARR